MFSFSRANTVHAATGINHQINFQGKIVNFSNGTNVADGSYSVIFSIYSIPCPGPAACAGTNLWTETQSITVTNGIFQVNLGSVTTLPASVDFNTDNIYLGIKVGTDAEMTPRVQFTSVPQAFNSEKLGGLDKTGFIQNGTSQQATSNFNISGSGTAGSLLTGTIDTAAAGALSVGLTNATGVTIAKTGVLTTVAGSLTVTQATTLSSTLALTGAPTAIATSSLIQVGAAIAGGNAAVSGGTYYGLNAPATGAGSAADFLNFQLNGVSKLSVTNAGAVTATSFTGAHSGDGSALTNLNGTNIATGTIANARLTNAGALTINTSTGLTGGGSVALGGTLTLSLANTAVVATSYGSASSVGTFTVNAQGQLTTAASTAIAIAATQITSGNYVATLGALTGLTTTGNTGTGSTPTLAVAYGAAGNNAAAGANTFTCPSGGSNLSGGSTTVTIGTSGTTCAALAVINNPSFSGLVTANGGLSIGSTAVIGQAKFTDGTVDGFAGIIQLAGAIAANQTYNLPTAGGTFCLSTNNCGYQTTGSYALTSDSTNFIRNQSSQQASSNFNISGTGTATTSLLTPTLDVASAGALGIGGTTATSVSISRTGIATTVNGSLTVTQGTTLSSTLGVSGAISGATATNTINGLIINSGALSGVTGITTNGGYTQSGATANTFTGASSFNALLTAAAGVTSTGGNVSLTGNAASSLTTSAGALTLTSATATTWSTAAGNLTLQAGSGTVSLGSSTSLTATAGLSVTSGGATTLSVDAGGAASLNLGTTNANAVTISRTGIATTVAGSLAVSQGTTLTGLLTVNNDLSFGQGANRTASVAANTTANGTGYGLTIAAGAANGSTTGAVGGILVLQGGAAAGSNNNNGGNLTLDGGASMGTGTKGNVVLQATGGNVGVGVSSPNALLQVLGSKPATLPTSGTNSTNGFRVTTGDGGDTSGSTSYTAGNAGSIFLTAGNGGTAGVGSANGFGGNIYLQAGQKGLGGGTSGLDGAVVINQSGAGTVGINGNTIFGYGSAIHGSTLFDGSFLLKPVSNSTSIFQIQNAAGTSTAFDVDSTNLRIGVGLVSPAYAVDAVGSVNGSVDLRVAGTTVCTSSGCTPASGSANYIQNTAVQQASSNFNISGTGTAATSLLTPTLDVASAGALGIGGTTATSVSISRTGIATTVNGSLTVTQGSTFNALAVHNADIQFGQGANRNLSVNANTTANGAGYNLALAAGAANGTTTGATGGNLTFLGGAAAGTGNNNGGNVTLDGGALTGSGAKGYIVLQGAGGNVGIGTATPQAALAVINSNSAQNAVLIKETASQNAGTYALDVQNSTGTTHLLSSTSTGLTVNGTSVLNYGGSTNTINSIVSNDGTQLLQGGNQFATKVTAPGSVNSAAVFGNILNTTTDASKAITFSGELFGGVGQLIADGTAGTTFTANSYGLLGKVQQSVATGTLSNAIGVAGAFGLNNGTTVTNAYSLYALGPQAGTSAGIQNAYGLYIKNVNYGTTSNYSIYSQGGQNYFGGRVGIGNAGTLTAALHITNATPVTVSGNGTAGTDGLTVVAGSGGATSGTGQSGGVAGNITLTAGNGGIAPAGSSNGWGGGITLQAGAQGAGAGSGGFDGLVQINPNNVGTFTVNGSGTFGYTSTFHGAVNIDNLFKGLAVTNGAATILSTDNFNQRVGIGTASPANKLSVNTLTTNNAGTQLSQLAVSTGAAANIGQIIQGAASQTGDLLQFQTSSGTVLTKFNANGDLSIGGTSSAASATALQVLNTTGTSVLNVDTVNSRTSLTGNTASDAATIGAELFTGVNTFGVATGWTAISGTAQTATATHTAGGGTTAISPATAITVTAGNTYQVTFTTSGATNVYIDSITPSIGGVNGGAIYDNSNQVQLITATGTGNLFFTPTTNWNGTVSAVSVKLVTLATAVLQVKSSSGSVTLEVRTGGSAANNNSFVGVGAGQANTTGNFNTASGAYALQSNTTGAANTASGTQALQYNTTGTFNTASGTYALQNNTTGSQNTASGYQALQSNTTGNYNAASGAGDLQSNTTGSQNTASGYSSLFKNTTGSYNTAFGINALYNNTTGVGNTASGNQALQNNTTGNFNTASGNGALQSNTTGSQNTSSGYNASLQDANGFTTETTLQSATTLGAFAQVQSSNNLILGSIGASGTTNVGIGTTQALNILSVEAIDYSTGTASQSGNTLFGAGGTFWTNAMIGDQITFADTASATYITETIIGITGSSQLSTSVSQTIASGNYRFHKPGLQVTNAGKVNVGTVTADANAELTVCSTASCALPTSAATAIAVSSSNGTTTGSSIRAKGTITGGLADVGEYIPFDGSLSNYPQGTVISASSTNAGTARLSNGTYDGSAIGIVSTTAAFIAGGEDGTVTYNSDSIATNRVIIALAGRVPVKATNENGAIRPGDYLTSGSVPGTAMKATKAGPTIGKALDYFDSASGTVLVQVNLSYYQPTTGQDIQAASIGTENLQVTGSAFINNLNVSGAAKLTNLEVTGNAKFAGDLTVKGLTTVADILVNGHLISAGSTPTLALGTASGTSLTTQPAPTAATDGTDGAGTITVTSGMTVTVPGTLAELTFNKSFPVGSTFKVALTPTNGNALDIHVYVEKTANGFKIVSKDKLLPGTSYSFDYIVIGAQQVAATP